MCLRLPANVLRATRTLYVRLTFMMGCVEGKCLMNISKCDWVGQALVMVVATFECSWAAAVPQTYLELGNQTMLALCFLRIGVGG